MGKLIDWICRSRAVLALILLLVLAGCATTPDNAEWIQLEHSRQARLDIVAAQCQTDLCLVMVAQESSRSVIRPPQQQHHPAWQIVDRALAIGVPAYFGSRQIRDLAGMTTDIADVIAGIDRSDNSVSIGGDQIGGDRIDDRSTGRDRVGGDWRQGDDIRDSCVGPDCRSNAPGPIDNSDNAVNNPPADPGDGGDP